MVISIPNILTTESSGNYIMSIRFRPDGLSFTGYNPEEEQTFFTRTIESDETMSYLSFVKEVFFANEWLTFPFKQFNIVFTDAPFMLVPHTIYNEARKKDLFSFIYISSPCDVCLVDHLEEEDSELLFSVEKDLYDFCCRSVIQPHFHYRFTSLLPLWKKQSRTEFASCMYVSFYGRKMSVFCYRQGKLSFVNTFDGDTENERLYFAMSVWKNLNLSQLTDYLYLMSDDKDELFRMREAFKVYVRNVKEVNLLSELKLRELNSEDFPIYKIALAL